MESFRDFLKQESTGSVSGLAAGQWPDDMKNGPEFSARGIRKKIETDDTDMSHPLRKTPEDLFGIQRKKLRFQPLTSLVTQKNRLTQDGNG